MKVLHQKKKEKSINSSPAAHLSIRGRRGTKKRASEQTNVHRQPDEQEQAPQGCVGGWSVFRAGWQARERGRVGSLEVKDKDHWPLEDALLEARNHFTRIHFICPRNGLSLASCRLSSLEPNRGLSFSYLCRACGRPGQVQGPRAKTDKNKTRSDLWHQHHQRVPTVRAWCGCASRRELASEKHASCKSVLVPDRGNRLVL